MPKNKKYISIMPSGYGHFRITGEVYNKAYSCITTDSELIDKYNSNDDRKRNAAKKVLQSKLTASYKNSL